MSRVLVFAVGLRVVRFFIWQRGLGARGSVLPGRERVVVLVKEPFGHLNLLLLHGLCFGKIFEIFFFLDQRRVDCLLRWEFGDVKKLAFLLVALHKLEVSSTNPVISGVEELTVSVCASLLLLVILASGDFLEGFGGSRRGEEWFGDSVVYITPFDDLRCKTRFIR